MNEFEKELTALINKYSLENGSNTPDYIIARYLVNCLNSYNTALDSRDKFFDFEPFKNCIEII